MKHYFLGMAAGYSSGEWLKHLFTIGRKKDCDKLKDLLSQKYEGEAILCKNGRSALTLALKAYFNPGDAILVNGFTCFAVYEAIKAAELQPIFVDIDRETLNYSAEALESILSAGPAVASSPTSQKAQWGTPSDDVTRHDKISGIIVQNTFGIPVNMRMIEEVAKKHDLTIIEDLAHCAGVRYPDGREAGTVGAATVLSFGKDKSIDTVSGGVVIMRRDKQHEIEAPSKLPKLSDHLRARFYPMWGALCRSLTYIGIGGVLMRLLVKIRLVERSADSKLDTSRRLSKFEAKRAYRQIKDLRRTGESPIREYYFVRDRAELLKKLQKKGYYFGGLWYEKPVSPERYYKQVDFPEKECPNALYVSEHIINLPIYYTKHDLKPATKLINQYLEKGEKGE